MPQHPGSPHAVKYVQEQEKTGLENGFSKVQDVLPLVSGCNSSCLLAAKSLKGFSGSRRLEHYKLHGVDVKNWMVLDKLTENTVSEHR